MSIPGLRNIIVGILICIVGIVVTAMTYSMARGGGHYVIAWGAVLFGAIQALQGLFQFLKHLASGPIDKVLAGYAVPFRALIVGLTAAMTCEGRPTDDETASAQAIVKQASDQDVSPATLRNAAAAAAKERRGGLGYLERHCHDVPQGVRELIVRGAFLVARIDPAADPMAKAVAVGAALRIGETMVHTQVAAMFAPAPAQPEAATPSVVGEPKPAV